jgi:hypothetical protein
VKCVCSCVTVAALSLYPRLIDTEHSKASVTVFPNVVLRCKCVLSFVIESALLFTVLVAPRNACDTNNSFCFGRDGRYRAIKRLQQQTRKTITHATTESTT